jgi:hypothetical protein
MSRTRQKPTLSTLLGGTISGEARRAIGRARTYAGPRHYTVLLLKAIRDGAVHNWESLTSFQKEHDLRFINWGSSMVGEAPAVITLLEELQRAGLAIVEGMDLSDIWVRTDNVRQSPPGRVVYDVDDSDPNHRLDHPDAKPPSALRIKVSPHWESIQGTLGISLTLLAELQHPRAKIVVPDAFPEPSRKQIYQDVFVAMPFDKALRPVYRHIAKVCKELSLSVARGDDFFTTHAVMADVWGAIQNARIIVADCTQRNPNVFYEMGIAHVLAKPVVLVSQKDEDIPFDLHPIRRIPYQNTPHGMKAFERTLEATLQTLLGRSEARS